MERLINNSNCVRRVSDTDLTTPLERIVELRMPMGLTFWGDKDGNVLITGIRPNSTAAMSGKVFPGDRVKMVSTSSSNELIPCDNCGLKVVIKRIRANGSNTVRMVLQAPTPEEEQRRRELIRIETSNRQKESLLGRPIHEDEKGLLNNTHKRIMFKFW